MVCLLGLVLLLLTPVVFAHAALIRSQPAHQSVLDAPPTQAVLQFNEPVTLLAISVLTPDGGTIELDKAASDGGTTDHGSSDATLIRVPLSGLTHAGSYGLSWRVVSADGHPLGGTLTFSIAGNATGVEQAGDRMIDGKPMTTATTPVAEASKPALPAPVLANDNSARNLSIWFTRWALYAVLFVVLASLLYAGTATPGQRRSAIGWLVTGPILLVAGVGLLGLDALDRSWSALLDSTTWHAALGTSYGATAAWLALALGLALAACWTVLSGARRLLGALALIAIALGLASSGHASSAAPAWLARPAVALHALAIALWMGALLPLYRELGDPDGQRPVLRGFSAFAPWMLVLLVLSGGALIWLQMDALSSLWQTPYGRLLAAKLVLVLMLFAIGAFNRYRLTAGVRSGNRTERLRMRRNVAIELVLAVVVFAVAAGWRFTPPPRALAATAAAPAQRPATVTARMQSNLVHAELAWRSGTPGSVTIVLRTPEGAAATAQQVGLAFSDPDAGIQPIRFDAMHAGDSTWTVDAIALPARPRWHVGIEVLVTDFDRARLHAIVSTPAD